MENMEYLGFNDIYKNKTVLITGHTGFKGSWLVTWLTMMGANVVGISEKIPTKPSLFELLNIEDRITHYFEDIRNKDAIEKIINNEKPDFLFHLAAQPIVSLSYQDPLDTISTNIMGTANILDSLRNTDFKCTVVVVTSDKCYDNVEWVWGYKETDHLGGKDIYSGSKGGAELITKSYYHSFFKKKNSKIRLATVRAGNIIGGGDWALDRIVPDLIRAWNANEKLIIRSPNATRPWQHVLDPLSGYLLVGEKLYGNIELNGDAFNFGPRHEINKPVIELVEDLAIIWNFKDPEDSYEILGNKTFDEASLLKLNCDKSLLQLKWLPVLYYNEFIDFTGKWYHEYRDNRKNLLKYTEDQIKEYCKLAKERDLKWMEKK